MTALDGNAIGGLLLEVFGTDMTSATAVCAACGAASRVAETVVYLDGPGTVVRCPHCATVLMIVTKIRARYCVGLGGIAALDPFKEVTMTSESSDRRPPGQDPDLLGGPDHTEHADELGGPDHSAGPGTMGAQDPAGRRDELGGPDPGDREDELGRPDHPAGPGTMGGPDR